MSRLTRAFFLFFTLIWTVKAIGTEPNPSPLWPDAEYDTTVPSVQSVLGYQPGQRITTHSDMLKYFEALASAQPTRIKIFEYGRTWEGRQLIYAVIGTPERIARLDEFKAGMQALSDPRKTDSAEAKSLIATLPSSVWLQHGVHGNEISSTDAAMLTAYHLLAAPEHPTSQLILDNILVFIDPLQNPDGRERFTSRYFATIGLEPSADRYSAEHNEPWPRGRSNHYLFDMNRDWLAITQPETAGKVAALNMYRPTVVIDLHEMGGDSGYFFPPAAQPVNPHMSEDQLENTRIIGEHIGSRFDEFGMDYFTREVYDAFYPGYGDSWPTFYGASASTYEVGSSRGDKYETKDGAIKHYRDTVQRHFVASIATAEATARNRAEILNDFYQYQVDAIKAGESDAQERFFVFSSQLNRAGSHHLATLLAEHGAEVSQAEASFKACGTQFPKGSYIVDTAQPRGRFVKTTLTQQVDMSDAFIKEQQRRRARKLESEIYDVTGWSLPLLFNVPVVACGKAPKTDSHLVSAADVLNGNITNPNASVAYVVSWGDSASGRFLSEAMRRGLALKSSDEAFTIEGKTYPAGSLVIEVKANNADLAQQIQQIATSTGALITGLNTSWVTDGPSFGSDKMPRLHAVNIAIAWDEPTSSLSAGSLRFVIERQFGYPTTAIRTEHIASADLDRYDVLILPSADYSSHFNESALEKVSAWINNGGVLITVGDATRYAASSEAGLLNAHREALYKEKTEDAPKPAEEDEATVDGTHIESREAMLVAIEPESTDPDYIAGIIAKVEVDTEHWLAAGVPESVYTTLAGDTIMRPVTLDVGKNIAWYSTSESLLASGYLWDSAKKQLAFKPVMVEQPVGDGRVIAFTQEPTSRAYLDGFNTLLLNALFRAPAH